METDVILFNLQLTGLANFDWKKYILKPKFLTYISFNFLVCRTKKTFNFVLFWAM